MSRKTDTAGTTGGAFVLDGLCFDRDGRAVLKNLTHVAPAGRIGIVGRNGSGKSTLARLIAGLVPPARGTVCVAGIDPADRRAALAAVGILFQNPDHQIIFPTVIEELGFGLRQQGADAAAAVRGAEAVLARFGKVHWRDSGVQRLSQGQKHLVCLMAVVAMAPRVLILDEPFAGLDIPTRRQLVRYLDRYEGDIVHISHDPADLADYDEVIWLDDGEIRAAGSSGEVLAAYVAAMEERGQGDDISDLGQ